MNYGHSLLKVFSTIGLIFTLGVSMNADAGILGFGGNTMSWKEEALLFDGSRLIVTRTVERGGRHEIGQAPPYKEQRLTFILPATSQRVIWEDHFSEDVGGASFLPLAIDIFGGTPYLVVSTMGCQAYSKWGRPNPPYVIFKNDGKTWKRIPLQELPVEITTPNLIFSAPYEAVEKLGKNYVTAEVIQEIVSGYRQAEYKTILREPLPSSHLCPPEQTGFKAPFPIPPKSGVANGK